MKFPEMPAMIIEATPKEQAIKVMEEAAEIVDALKANNERQAIYEVMDTIAALATLCNLMGWDKYDLGIAARRVIDTNTGRGRIYEQ